MRRRTATLRARIPWATSRACAACDVPNLARLGLGNIKPLAGIPAAEHRPELTAAARWLRPAKTRPPATGRWPASISTSRSRSFPTDSRARSWTNSSGASAAATLGNKAASGTEIIEELGAEHMRTGSPIVYTSADSVFQVAAHEEVIPLWELYKICETAREHSARPGRSRARDRAAVPGRARHLHAHLQPPRLCRAAARAACCSIGWKARGVAVHSVGKIFDVFLGRGIRDIRQDQEQR